MNPWNNHNACNRYVAVDNAAETHLARFKHYRDRFENQLESLKMERELCENIKNLAKELQKTADMTANQVGFHNYCEMFRNHFFVGISKENTLICIDL